MKVMVTGANGNLGRRLIGRLAAGGHEPMAVVRSKRAAAQLRAAGVQCVIREVDYTDAAGLRRAGEGCEALVHLAGIIKESRGNSFQRAHEDCCQALVDAGLGVKRIICLGVLGTAAESDNACFRSRARAEAILAAGPAPVLALRVPMVLGPGDYASRALAKQASSRLAVTWRAASREQPIASDDLLAAILAALGKPPMSATLSLAGPESLSRRRLIKRAASQLGRRPAILSLPGPASLSRRVASWLGHGPAILSLPLSLGMALAWLLERLMPAPPITRAMLGVLDHDDAIDPLPAAKQLGIRLISLDETLRKSLPRS